MTHWAILISTALLLQSCGDGLAVKSGFGFVVDESAILTGGPVWHCRSQEQTDTLFCERTQRSNYDYVISSGVFLRSDQDRFDEYRHRISDNTGSLVRSPVAYRIHLAGSQLLLLVVSEPFSDANFENHRVILDPQALAAFRSSAFPPESGVEAYSVEVVFPFLTETCRAEAQAPEPSEQPQIHPLGGPYWAVPERCVDHDSIETSEWHSGEE